MLQHVDLGSHCVARSLGQTAPVYTSGPLSCFFSGLDVHAEFSRQFDLSTKGVRFFLYTKTAILIKNMMRSFRIHPFQSPFLIVMSIFPHCSARLWSCWHDDFDGLQMATSMTLRSTLYNFRNLQASYGTADITPSLYPGASFSIILLHGVPRSSIEKAAAGSQTSNQRRSDVRLWLCLKPRRMWTGCWIVPGYKTLAAGRVELAFWWKHEKCNNDYSDSLWLVYARVHDDQNDDHHDAGYNQHEHHHQNYHSNNFYDDHHDVGIFVGHNLEMVEHVNWRKSWGAPESDSQRGGFVQE